MNVTPQERAEHLIYQYHKQTAAFEFHSNQMSGLSGSANMGKLLL